jgi:hypothetical protein
MRVLQSATRVLAATILAALAVGCGKDSNAPDSPFDPAGTSSDLAAMNASFESPAMASFSSAATDIAMTTGGSAALALQVRPTAMLAKGDKASAMRYAGALAKALTSRPRASLAVAASVIPTELLGTTFVWDVETQQYAASDLTGAPANGIRFLLYAVNPVTRIPTEPLTEVGYADVVTTATSVNIVVVSDNVTYLDYSARVAATSASSANINVAGYVTNGQDRVNFDLDNGITINMTASDTTLDLTQDYLLTVPTRGAFRIDLESTLTTSFKTDNQALTLDLSAQGEHGVVRITGTETNGTGIFQVKVNGELFATIEVTAGSQPVVTGKDGGALTADEEAALENVFHVFGGGLEFFIGLLGPLDA